MSSKKTSKTKILFLAAEYNGRKATLLRTPRYQDTIAAVKRAFKPLRSTPADDIEIHAWFEEHADLIRITEDLWRDLLPEISSVKIILDTSEGGLVTRNAAQDLVEANVQPQKQEFNAVKKEPIIIPTTTRGKKIHLNVYFSGSETISRFCLSINCRIQRVADVIAKNAGLCPNDLRILYDGTRISGSTTPQFHGMEDEDSISISVDQVGGKPVIYIFPPTPTENIRLDLALAKSWDFSALYPPTSISTPHSETLGQAVSWIVNAKPDGTLFDQGTQREVAYLFWEAHSNPVPPISPTASRPGTPTAQIPVTFDPARPDVTPANSIILPSAKITAYIDDALLSLGLHTEARTSFITYWLPGLQRHNFVALRFLPQEVYEATAPMTVNPTPNVTTRVFMVFKGVEENQLGMWEEAQARSAESPSMWSHVVGVDLEMTQNTKLFRVLEWGGMEIK